MERPASPEKIEQIKLATASDPQLRRILDYNNNNNNNNNNAVLGHYTMSQCPYKFTNIEK